VSLALLGAGSTNLLNQIAQLAKPASTAVVHRQSYAAAEKKNFASIEVDPLTTYADVHSFLKVPAP
jgi:ABC-type lipoprotein export system ATPase subunit